MLFRSHFLADEPEERAHGRIRIEPEDLNGAFDADRVIVALTSTRGGRGARGGGDGTRMGRVEMILRRGRLKIVGRLRHGFRDSWVESLDEKFAFDIEIDRREVAELADGWIVAVEVTGYPAGRQNPTGRLLEALGADSDAPGMDIDIVIHKHDLPHLFPAEVLAESEAVSPVVTDEQLAGRLDLRETQIGRAHV